MPSTDGAIGLGLGTRTLGKGTGLRSTKFDEERVERTCGATLPYTHARTTSHQGCKRSGHAYGRPRHAELALLGGMVAVGRLVGLEVEGCPLLPRSSRGWSALPGQLRVAMHRYAR